MRPTPRLSLRLAAVVVTGLGVIGYAAADPVLGPPPAPTTFTGHDAPTDRSLSGASQEDTMGIFSFGSTGSNSARHTDIRPGDLASWKGKARLVDVREPHEFNGDLGHVEGAELVPLGTVGDAMKSWDKETPIIVICRSGGRSGRAAEALVRAGFSQVMNLAGGMMGYQGAGLPVARR